MTLLSDIIASMSIVLANGDVDLGCEAEIEAFLRSTGFSPDKIHAGWEEARDLAREMRQFSGWMPETEAA